MLLFARACVGLAGFLWKISVAVKKLFSSTIFPEFRYMHTGTWFMYIICIFGDPCQVSKMFLKKLEFVDNSPPSTHMYEVCIVI